MTHKELITQMLGALDNGAMLDDGSIDTDYLDAITAAREYLSKDSQESEALAAPEQSEPPRFPTMLRKMWSGSEVQQWINDNWYPAPKAETESAYQRGYLDGMAKPCTDCADYRAMYLKVRDELSALQQAQKKIPE